MPLNVNKLSVISPPKSLFACLETHNHSRKILSKEESLQFGDYIASSKIAHAYSGDNETDEISLDSLSSSHFVCDSSSDVYNSIIEENSSSFDNKTDSSITTDQTIDQTFLRRPSCNSTPIKLSSSFNIQQTFRQSGILSKALHGMQNTGLNEFSHNAGNRPSSAPAFIASDVSMLSRHRSCPTLNSVGHRCSSDSSGEDYNSMIEEVSSSVDCHDASSADYHSFNELFSSSEEYSSVKDSSNETRTSAVVAGVQLDQSLVSLCEKAKIHAKYDHNALTCPDSNERRVFRLPRSQADLLFTPCRNQGKPALSGTPFFSASKPTINMPSSLLRATPGLNRRQQCQMCTSPNLTRCASSPDLRSNNTCT